MSNLKSFNNLYADLAESTYNERPKNFPPFSKNTRNKCINYSQGINYKNSKGEVSFTNGGINLPNDGTLYLQPDKTLHAENVSTNSYIFDNKFA